MRSRRDILVGLLLGLTLTSCAHPPAPVDTSQGAMISTGMSEAEVLRRLGPPGMIAEQSRTSVQVHTPQGLEFREKRRYTYYYPGTAQMRDTLITFEDGVVVDTGAMAR